MFLISSILDKRLESDVGLLQCWAFTTLARSRCQFCKWCKYKYGKRGKKRVHRPFCTRLYDLFLKVYFSENWYLALLQFMKIWKTREMFFLFSRFCSCSFHRLLSRRFLSHRKRKPSLSFQHYRKKN